VPRLLLIQVDARSEVVFRETRRRDLESRQLDALIGNA
jgi:hypothetical protein